MKIRIGRAARLAGFGLLLAMSSCATAYQSQGITGGFSEVSVSGDDWTVRFAGNGYTNGETVQSYWLYHCAELALSKGYAGFQIITPMTLAALHDADQGGQARIIKVHGTTGGGGHVVTYGGGYAGGVMVYKPTLTGTIRLLKAPIAAVPEHHLFDAAVLKAQLAPYVLGEKCNGNICPHLHSYLYSPQPKPAA